jgi:putative endonuclease
MKGFIYLLLSQKDKKTYLGSTSNLERRLLEHTKGLNISTKNRRPLKLIYNEEYDNLADARARERFLKSRSGRRELAKIIQTLGSSQAVRQ